MRAISEQRDIFEGGRVYATKPRRVTHTFVKVTLAFLLLFVSSDAVWKLSSSQLASIEFLEEELESRSRNSDADSYSALAAGVSTLLASRSSVGWFFPHYREAVVRQSTHALRIAFEVEQDPFHRAEAAFLLAKGQLMLGNVDQAVLWLERCLEQQVFEYRIESEVLLSKLNHSTLSKRASVSDP
jgi:hypothetical protein